MLVVLAPAKTQSVIRRTDVASSELLFSEQAEYLAALCQDMDTPRIMELMDVSERLAEKTRLGYRDFRLPHAPELSGTALSTFQGDAYGQMRALEYTIDELHFAQRHVRILSGLYGLLRPLDLMQPYRLEMAAKLATSQGTNLYQFWGESITRKLNEDLAGHREPVILDCASREYSRSIIPTKLAGRILTLSFRQRKNDRLKTIAIYAKRARGLFVDWLISNRVTDREQLADFDRGGYRFSPELSSDAEYVFLTRLDS
jgi:cytoplasmic iron level regulating protein YaaA (DUF328/UPF0246 family)